jgi:hypothetical protein
MRMLAVGVFAIAVAGCQGLYDGRPAPLPRTPKPTKHVEPPDPAATIRYVEDCPANFRGTPITDAQRDRAGSERLARQGTDAVTTAAAQKDPVAQASGVTTAIDKLGAALSKDPYNADATLELALAYHRVYRKGCALKLLGRIATLENHPKFRAAAKQAADRVSDSTEWFGGYRREALVAVGRP